LAAHPLAGKDCPEKVGADGRCLLLRQPASNWAQQPVHCVSKLKTATVRRSLALIMLAIVVLSVAWWLGSAERMPDRLIIAGGSRGGSFDRIAHMLAEELRESTGARVEVKSTDGSVENRDLLEAGKADFGMISADTLLPANTAIVTPVYDEFVHIIVRADSPIKAIPELNHKRVIVGPAGSADQAHAEIIFHHYGVQPSRDSDEWVETYELPKLPIVEAAVEITSMGSPGLRQMLGSGRYRLLPVDDARAIAFDHNFYRVDEIPRGIYSGFLGVPPEPVETLSCTARLAAPKDTPAPAIRAALNAVFGERMQREFPGLLTQSEAEERVSANWHPTSASFLQPYAGIDTVATFLESLSAAKELIVAVAALLWLGWQRYRSLRDAEQNENLMIQKERLDIFVNRTLEIDKMLTETTCTGELRDLHHKVTELQHLALTELTEDELRGDRLFQIFLDQSNSLCRKIENRLLSRRLAELLPEGTAET